MRRRAFDPTSLLPLMPAEFQILLALADDDRHGYGIMTEVKERTNGAVAIGPGTLYGTVKRLVERGLVEEADERHDPSLNDKRRRYYHLTKLGRRTAAAEAERLVALVRDARAKELIGP